jgi:transcriptional regulator with XRE-family HTH domain
VRVTKELGVEVPGLGEKIRQARLSDRRSLKNICDTVGMSTMNWYRIEKEKQSLPLEQLKKIEEVLGVNFGVRVEGWDD